MVFISAFIIDLVLGDIGGKLHPVAVMGFFISLGERVLYRPWGKVWLFVAGGLLTLAGVTGAYIVASLLPPAIEPLALAALICPRTLAVYALNAARALERGDIDTAKAFTAVSRTLHTPADICRASIESTAENLTDGVVAPLLWFAAGGLPAAAAYRMVNTLDAMIGYHNERYEYFGKVAARVDDVANFVPARVAAVAIIAAAIIIGANWRHAIFAFINTLAPNPRLSSPNAPCTPGHHRLYTTVISTNKDYLTHRTYPTAYTVFVTYSTVRCKRCKLLVAISVIYQHIDLLIYPISSAFSSKVVKY